MPDEVVPTRWQVMLQAATGLLPGRSLTQPKATTPLPEPVPDRSDGAQRPTDDIPHGSSGLDTADHVRATWPDALIVFVTANPAIVLPDIEYGEAVVPEPFPRNGLIAALSFLERGIKTPPPDMPPPNGLIPNQALRVRWELT